MISYEEKLKIIRMGKKLIRSKRRIKFIGYMKKTDKRAVYVRVK